jgi:hypothetical protein
MRRSQDRAGGRRSGDAERASGRYSTIGGVVARLSFAAESEPGRGLGSRKQKQRQRQRSLRGADRRQKMTQEATAPPPRRQAPAVPRNTYNKLPSDCGYGRWKYPGGVSHFLVKLLL